MWFLLWYDWMVNLEILLVECVLGYWRCVEGIFFVVLLKDIDLWFWVECLVWICGIVFVLGMWLCIGVGSEDLGFYLLGCGLFCW